MKTSHSRGNTFYMLLLVMGLVPVCGALAAPAELVVGRANVITVDKNRSRAQAFAVADGKFVVVGGEESAKPFTGANTRVLDLAGKTVVPGFIDAHANPGPKYPEESPWASADCRPEIIGIGSSIAASLPKNCCGASGNSAWSSFRILISGNTVIRWRTTAPGVGTGCIPLARSLLKTITVVTDPPAAEFRARTVSRSPSRAECPVVAVD